MRALSSNLRKQLETAVLAARRAAESASRAAVDGLGVFLRDKPGHLDADQAALRNGLRAKWRQLGEDRELLVAECAYEQWHRLLFARFLAENDLLLHPQYKAPVTLADCDELAAELGEPDGWSVAARFAAEILPGIFRLDDPSFRLRLAPEGRQGLEQILDGLPPDVFVADDALGWVYQFWQKDKKDEVNASERKVGGADLGPVTQLFTENYMVRFLLENSLGAWWASRHPESLLVKDFEYLRLDDEGKPAAGSFDGWPESVANVTVMDPCCGSGHFLVEAFSMLWRMRSEDERLDPVDAQDAVLRQNLFGLEIDPRCVQIAMFALALVAWKAGGRWRDLPVPNIACSGIPVKASVEEWQALAKGDERLENSLGRLHTLFKDADTLGSLIDPRRAAERASAGGHQRSFEDADWGEVAPLLQQATVGEGRDPATAVLGADAVGVARAAGLLSQCYTLVVTNPPFLSEKKQHDTLSTFLARWFSAGASDLATGFVLRMSELAVRGGCVAAVSPQNWHFQGAYERLRMELLEKWTWCVAARLGTGAFSGGSTWDFNTLLSVFAMQRPDPDHVCLALDASGSSYSDKPTLLQQAELIPLGQRAQLGNPDARIILSKSPWTASLLEQYAVGRQGIKTGDDGRYRRKFWELPALVDGWARFHSSSPRTTPYGGRSDAVLWEDGEGTMATSTGSRIVGRDAWGQNGVLVSQMGSLPVTLYTGDLFDTNASPIVPTRPDTLAAIWSFCCAPEYSGAVREVDTALKVTNRTLCKVPFDLERWQRVADEAGPLPEPWSDDPTQWLFDGRPDVSTERLQVAVGRLLGYRWPEQPETDDLDTLADGDGIVGLPPVGGSRRRRIGFSSCLPRRSVRRGRRERRRSS